MFLSAYTFTGSPEALAAGWHRLVESVPSDEVTLNVCITTATGITVYDACPSQQEAEEWAASAHFTDHLRAAGLPTPVITPLGEVHAVVAKQAITA